MSKLKFISPNNRNTYIPSGVSGSIPVRADDMNPIIETINTDSDRITALESSTYTPPYDSYVCKINNQTGVPVATIVYKSMSYNIAVSGNRKTIIFTFPGITFDPSKIVVITGNFVSDIVENVPGIAVSVDFNAGQHTITLTTFQDKGMVETSLSNYSVEIRLYN